MIKRFLLLLLLAFATSAYAHPGVGIVVDSKGNVFYTDLEKVWRIAPDGKATVAVPNVHTHELYLDASDNLYGEHLWYNGEAANTWGHYIWRRTAAGKVETIVKTHEPFKGIDYSFVRDKQGNSYWAEPKKAIYKIAPDGTPAVFATGTQDVRWMTLTPNGTLYFTDTKDLYRVEPNRMTKVAHDLTSANMLRPWTGDRHRLMGLWSDAAGNVYVADYANGEVKRVDSRGNVKVVVKSSFPWAPTGGVFAPNGDLWLLEYKINDARARRVSGTCCRPY